MPIYKNNETLPAQPVIVMIYGDPGTSKTSLANTCEDPLILDFDRGFKRSYGRPDALIISEGWKEVEHSMANGDFNAYKTIVIDTVKGALDDFIMPHVVESDYKLKTNKLKAFGELGEQFKLFVNKLRLMGKDVFIIAHAKQKEEGDINRSIADITGSSGGLVLRIADQVGFLTMRNGKRVLSFNPTDTSVGKNVAGLADLELPLHTSPQWNGFAGREIIQKVKDALTTMSEEQRQALEIIAEWQSAIDCIVEDGRDVNKELQAIGKDYAEQVPQEHLQKQIRQYLLNHIAKIGYKWDSVSKSFIKTDASTNGQAKAAEAPKEEAPMAETPPTNITDVVIDDMNAQAETTPAAEAVENIDVAADAEKQRADLGPPPVINKNPNLAPPKDDLFARRDG